jgi:2-amino-4-hydroxy-6-hydroxymethyldihydropteridine diphosphokinase
MQITNFQDYAFIGLGSNLGSVLGSPRDIVLEASKQIEKLSDERLFISSFHLTAPLDCPPGSPNFINAVLALLPRQQDTPFTLLESLQRIESRMGRVRSGIVNEARLIDLDLLLFRDERVESEVLSLPHPAMLDRDFVLNPLKELLESSELSNLLTFVKKTLRGD